MHPEPREPRKQQVFEITTAAESSSDERSRRERRYALSMAIRTVCFLLGVVLVLQGSWMAWVGWFCFVGAVFLPYIAVVFANAGVRRKGDGPSPFGVESDRPQLQQRPTDPHE